MKRTISRRGFVTSATAVTGAAFQVGRAATADADLQHPSPHPPHAKFCEIPLSAIEPQGWLKAYLTAQKNGITGHLDETGGFPFNTYGWTLAF